MTMFLKQLQEALNLDLGLDNIPSFPPPDADPVLASKIFLANSLLKKYVGPSGKPKPDAVKSALNKFNDANYKCKTWVPRCNTSIDEALIGEFKSAIHTFFYPIGDSGSIISSLDEIFERGGVGPGASLNAPESDFRTKAFRCRLSASNQDVLWIWDRMTNKAPRWRAAQAVTRSEFPPIIREASNTSFVPKNISAARQISTEPTANMWFQLGIGRILADHLARLGLSVQKQQSVNGEMARLGSLHDSLVTIDLASASDSISLYMVREYFPRGVTAMLEKFRSTCTQYQGVTTQLGMLSTMGNGYTFALQMVIFYCVCKAALRTLGIMPKSYGPVEHRNVGVYGDDIIVPRSSFNRVSRLLHLLGFTINEEKSFIQGPFRESCGQDFWSGVSVRGVYIKNVATPASRFVAINALNRWSSHDGRPVLSSTLKLLLKSTPKIYVPPFETDDAGLHVPLDRAYIKQSKLGCFSYWKLTPVKRIIKIDMDSEPSRNDDSNIIAFLGGYIRDHCIALRLRDIRYVKKRKSVASWDNFGIRINLRIGDITHQLHSDDSRWRNIAWAPWSRVASFLFED